MSINIRTATIEELALANAQIPEFGLPYTVADFQARLNDRNWLGQVAIEGEQCLGFKVGYADDAGYFYSWLGGVLPAARKRGVARLLIQAQEAWVRDQGFNEIRVKSRNRFRHMLMFLLSERYEVLAVEPASPGDHLTLDRRIWFSKTL